MPKVVSINEGNQWSEFNLESTCGVIMASSWTRLVAVAVALLLYTSPISCQVNGLMSCTDIGSSCPAYLYYTLNASDTLEYLGDLFSVSQDAIKQEKINWNTGGVVVSVQCLCSDSLTYAAEAAHRVNPGDTQASVVQQYRHLTGVTSQRLVAGQLLQLRLLCGCIDSLGQPLLSFVAHKTDTLDNLAKRFNASTTTIRNINNHTKQDYLTEDAAYYIPIYDSDLKPVVVLPYASSDFARGNGGVPLGALVGVVPAGLLLIAAIAALVFFLQKRNICCYKSSKLPIDARSPASSPYDARTSDDNSTSLRRSKAIPGGLLERGPLGHEDLSLRMQHQISVTLSKDLINNVFGMEKPIFFAYDEIASATSDFADANHIGVDAYAHTYFGLLRDQEVAVKKIRATKTKGIYADLRELCKLHHTNLVELIGYSISDFDLFLVYEHAENGSVSERLHDPQLKGCAVLPGLTPFTWNSRVQIALDTARGLEFIHDHSRNRCVHRDVKTSNILLDGYFRAKVADFGLAKIVERLKERDVISPHVIGTFGYLAPECLRDGQATSKSDVYAFGVVLFELITSREAIFKSRTSGQERSSLISLMLSALNDPAYDRPRLKAIVDPLLQDMFSLDSVLMMATLGKHCVEEDPQDRPDMKRIAVTLSQILLSCIEWETGMAARRRLGAA